jgi:hypothetical protein
MLIYSTSYVATIGVKPRVDGEKPFNDINFVDFEVASS